MFLSFATARSALSGFATAVDIAGNNLANLNTPGYKASRASFRDLVTQQLGAHAGEVQAGFGIARPMSFRQFTQGSLQPTSGLLDAAIEGDGFFVLRDLEGGALYTRAGAFQVDGSGYLVTAAGQRVQGWTDPNGAVNANELPGDILIPVGMVRPPKATTALSVDLNLNAAAPAMEADAEVAPPGAVFTTPVEVIDSLGGAHILTLSFTKTGANTWSYEVSIPAPEVSEPPAGPLATGTLEFDSNGRLPDTPSPPVTFTISGLANGADDLDLTWNLYPNGSPSITQYEQPSAVAANSQDGIRVASAESVSIGDGGRIVVKFSNGEERSIGQLAVASIRNPDSMSAAGDNNFRLSVRTAEPAVGLPGTGGRGEVGGGALESSTVDIATEFTNLIVFQRGYQANSKIVSALDELSQETINMKR